MKTVKRRDSAIAILRKLGLSKSRYNDFLSAGESGGWQVDIDGAKAVVEARKEEINATRREGKPRRKLATVASVCRELILKGMDNDSVWKIVCGRFNLDYSKRYYPSWYRCQLRRQGLLAKKEKVDADVQAN